MANEQAETKAKQAKVRHQQLEAALEEAQARANSLEADRASLEASLETLRGELQEVNQGAAQDAQALSSAEALNAALKKQSREDRERAEKLADRNTDLEKINLDLNAKVSELSGLVSPELYIRRTQRTLMQDHSYPQ